MMKSSLPVVLALYAAVFSALCADAAAAAAASSRPAGIVSPKVLAVHSDAPGLLVLVPSAIRIEDVTRLLERAGKGYAYEGVDISVIQADSAWESRRQRAQDAAHSLQQAVEARGYVNRVIPVHGNASELLVMLPHARRMEKVLARLREEFERDGKRLSYHGYDVRVSVPRERAQDWSEPTGSGRILTAALERRASRLSRHLEQALQPPSSTDEVIISAVDLIGTQSIKLKGGYFNRLSRMSANNAEAAKILSAVNERAHRLVVQAPGARPSPTRLLYANIIGLLAEYGVDKDTHGMNLSPAERPNAQVRAAINAALRESNGAAQRSFARLFARAVDIRQESMRSEHGRKTLSTNAAYARALSEPHSQR